MTHTERIIRLDDALKDSDEMFVGTVRRGDRLIRCKDCARNENCFMYRESGDDNGYCAWAVKRGK